MKQKRILLIEDNSAICDALSELLAFEGYEVIVTSNGFEGLNYLKDQARSRPDLILLDLMMPVMDGFQFLKEKSAEASICSIPVFVMSADGRNSDEVQKLGAEDYFRKPLDIDRLLETIKRKD